MLAGYTDGDVTKGLDLLGKGPGDMNEMSKLLLPTITAYGVIRKVLLQSTSLMTDRSH